MPRWKALPQGLDPEVKEFADQLRRLVDRSGLSIAAVADRTGYSKTSWERYLNGRLLAPRGAIVALAEVTGTNQNHLSTMWELAERAWSRSEMRHDMTMEAIRISQARAALGESGPGAGPGAGQAAGSWGARSGGGRHSGGAGTGVSTAAGPGGVPAGTDARPRDAGRPPSVPVQRGSGPPAAGGYGPGAGTGPGTPAQRPNRRAGQGQQGSRRKVTMFAVGVVGALVVIAGAVMLTDFGGDGSKEKATATPSAAPTPSAPELPAGVECSGADCAGQDPEKMGCGGQFASTVSRVTVGGALVEVRYSETCAAAWARITEAGPGDTVRISAGAAEQDGTVEVDTDAYTPMVAVKKAADAKACATLASGTKGCTTPQ